MTQELAASQGEVREPGAEGVVHVGLLGEVGDRRCSARSVKLVARAWRREGQRFGPRFKCLSLSHYFSYSQPSGSSGGQQQGIMGLVVFSVRGRGPGCLEVHRPWREALGGLLGRGDQSRGCSVGFQRRDLAGGWPALALPCGFALPRPPPHLKGGWAYVPLGPPAQSGAPAPFRNGVAQLPEAAWFQRLCLPLPSPHCG